MEIRKSGSQPSAKGPEEYFTGNVRIDPLMQAAEPARNSCALVTFAGRALCLALASSGADLDGNSRLRLGAERGRAESGDSSGRRCLVSSA